MAKPAGLPSIVAHRGDMEQFLENTLVAFHSAIEKGADAIELDVHLTNDGEIAVHHDYYLDRCTNGSGFISNYTLAELKQLDAGSWFDRNFSAQKIPTLKDIFELGTGAVRFEVEVKTPSKELCSLVLKMAKDMKLLEDVVLTSAHSLLIQSTKHQNPDLVTGLIFSDFPDWMEDAVGFSHIASTMHLADANFAHLSRRLLWEEGINSLHLKGYKVHIGCNESNSMISDFLSSDADQFSTNFLDEALRMRNAQL
ncbi:MAG: hypothetical protein DWG76_05480 [Chloroflexi bacterium]|nr:glycerophosphodiester phosphodiesterase family protein [Chloroflexota bacterium]MQC26882.1 hypothetical protein [Chloroflexota bacterium]